MTELTHTPLPIPREAGGSAAHADERAARRALREQVARLEEDVAGRLPRRAAGGARLMSLGELEELRDAMVEQAARGRAAREERGCAEEWSRRLMEEMLLDPDGHRWAHISSEDLGEPGCRHWHVRPRWGLLGILMRWWRVVVSSGCP